MADDGILHLRRVTLGQIDPQQVTALSMQSTSRCSVVVAGNVPEFKLLCDKLGVSAHDRVPEQIDILGRS